MNEIWKEIDGFGGQYLISNLGRVKSIKSNKIMKQRYSRGYLVINLCDKSFRKIFLIHRLVAQAFIPNPENKREVNHINGIKDDNSVQNLEWVTPKENMEHSRRTGLNKGHPKTKPSIAKKVRCIETGKIYKSVGLASKELGLNRCAVSHQIARRGKCKGLTFVFV